MTQGLHNFLFGSHGFLFERRQGEIFVGLVRFTFLFRVELAQLFVGFALSGSPIGLSQFFFLFGRW